jgi:putative transposase
MDAPEIGHPHRKRLRRREASGRTRFMTFSCYRRLPLLNHPRIKDLFADALAVARTEHSFKLFAWVVMPEHVHLLLRPAEGTAWGQIASSMKTRVARRVVARWRVLDAPVLSQLQRPEGGVRFWQHGGGFDRTVRDEPEFCRHVTYIHRNPVERGLVRTPQEWTWSSVRWWLGERDGELECDRPPGWDRGMSTWRGFM